MTTTYTVTLPDGTTAQRTSANHTYPYAVAVGPADPTVYAARLRSRATQARAAAALLDAAADAGEVRIVNRGWGVSGSDDYDSHEAVLVGSASPDPRYNLTERCNAHGVGYSNTKYLGGLDVLPGTHPWSSSGYVLVDARAQVIQQAREKATQRREDADGYDAEAAQVEAAGTVTGRDGEWAVLRWTSRLDLAQSYAGGEEFGYAREVGRPVVILETTAAEGRARKRAVASR